MHLDNLEDDYLIESFIFDLYKNKKNNEIKLGIRLIFQAKDKTLSDEEIQESVQKLLKPILKLDGVSIPGMK